MNVFTCGSAEQTIDLGYQLGQKLPTGSIVCLFGPLGAGKTTFIKGLAAGFAGVEPRQISSPTFVYLNIYQGDRTLYHFDLYRLNHSDEFLNMGFDEMLFSEGACCIEWPERISTLLPANCIKISLQHSDENTRLIRFDS